MTTAWVGKLRVPVDPVIPCRFADLKAASSALTAWLATAALPLWATSGRDEAGGFREALTVEGVAFDLRRRVRVQARQAYVFARAAEAGLPGPWRAVARDGLERLLREGRRDDGLFVHTLTPTGEVANAQAHLYEQAFVLLAMSAQPALGAGPAAAIRQALESFRHRAGGFREAGASPFQANALMHLFEAALAWEAVGGEVAAWANLADELAELALARLIDPAAGALHEHFDAAWRPLGGAADAVEPGHQFEWAWLLADWGDLRGDPRGRRAAERLYQAGLRGVDASRGVVVDSLWDDLAIREASARLWPQTEYLKAALRLGRADDALQAALALARFLDTPVRGLWRERMRPDGGFLDEPAPATSLYHLAGAILALRHTVDPG